MKTIKVCKGAGSIAYYHKLNHPNNWRWRLNWKPVCSSTETVLSKWIADHPVLKNQPRALCASRQRFGKGQYGRIWESPKGGVWISAAINQDSSLSKSIELYGLAIALALAQRIEMAGINVKIKWPNDLLVNGQKLAGFLPRLIFRGGKLRLIRVGVGLNVSNKVPKTGISLVDVKGCQKTNINFWSAEVLFAIENSIELCKDEKLLCKEVERRLWKKIFIEPKTGHKWNIKGIDPLGGLILSRGDEEKIWSLTR